MNIIDIGIIIILLVIGCIGYLFGLINMVFIVSAMVLGNIAASKFYLLAAGYLPQKPWTVFVSYSLCFFITASIILIISRVLIKLIDKLMLRIFDRILGAMILIFLGFFVIGVAHALMPGALSRYSKKINSKESPVLNFIINIDKKIYGHQLDKAKKKVQITIQETSKTVKSSVSDRIPDFNQVNK
ncbi:MAG: CvpA family protein [Elusimicrobiota bacterium]